MTKKTSRCELDYMRHKIGTKYQYKRLPLTRHEKPCRI
jgi:hypothetical protein